MANEIRGDISIRGADKAGRDLKNVGDSADKAGTEFKDMAEDANFLGSEVTRLEAHLKDLTRQLNATGDTSLLKDIRKDRRQLSLFSKLAKEIAPEAGSAGAETGKSFADGLISAATAVSKSGGPIVIGGLAAAAVAAAPFIGASIAAAVLGGAGAGGIIGGIALAARDPRVAAAAEDIGAEMLHALEPIGASFVDPVLNSLDLFGRAVSDIADKAGPALGELAKEVEPLAKGFADMAENALPGFLKALDAAKPILRVLADELPEIGDAVSEMFTAISSGGDGATMALSVLLDVVEGSLIHFGRLVGLLGQTYQAMVAVGLIIGDAADAVVEWSDAFGPLLGILPWLNDILGGQAGALDSTAEGGDRLKRAYKTVAVEAKTAAEEVQGLTDAVSDFLGVQMSADQAALRWTSGLRDLNEELREGKRTLDASTEAGEANVGGLLRQISVAGQVRDAAIAQGDGTKEAMDKANEAYRANIQALYNMAAAAGFNKAELDKMFAPYLNGPRQAITEFSFPGLQAGLARVRELARLLGSNVAAVNQGDPYAPGRASGGPVQAGRPYLVGEEGPELIVPGQSGTVMTATQTAAMRSGASGGSAWGGSEQVVEHHHTITINGTGVLSGLREVIRLKGGNVQKTLGA
jgi:hypothetical protein